ncbi:hypothetical protein [Paenibacillus sp. GCM10012306]|uniref:hypothetical protein n=1 Tax=Paenibacillus sp. GCM10012306 TaxID=3317342 RepID=UPI00360F5E99
MANKTRIYGEEIIDEIIHRYIALNNITGEIEYSGVRDFAFHLWNIKDPLFTNKMYYQLIDPKTDELPKKKIYKNIKLSDDFWRKPQYQGRQRIDAVNNLLSETVSKANTVEQHIPKIDTIIEMHKNSPTLLKMHLNRFEKLIKSCLSREKKLEEKVEELLGNISEIKKEKKRIEKQNQALQDTLFKLFEYSYSRDVPLENQLNTGKGRSNIVERALRDTFSGDPSSFYSLFNNNSKKTLSIASLDEYRSKQTNIKVSSYEKEYDFD